VREWLEQARADVFFEASSLDVHTGQPAIDHIKAALELGAHAISGTKGRSCTRSANWPPWRERRQKVFV